MPQVKKVMRQAVLAFSTRSRRRKAAVIEQFMARRGVRTVALVGCGGGTSSNEWIIERAVASRAEVLVAVDIFEVKNLPWPFLEADGRDLPFEDDYADMVLANAVIEHVGDVEDQKRFVAEQTRVGRSWVITTPNRWFPVESHTSAVLRHWSPKWRGSRREFTRLLSLGEFRALLPEGTVINGKPWSATFTAMYPGG